MTEGLPRRASHRRTSARSRQARDGADRNTGLHSAFGGNKVDHHHRAAPFPNRTACSPCGSRHPFSTCSRTERVETFWQCPAGAARNNRSKTSSPARVESGAIAALHSPSTVTRGAVTERMDRGTKSGRHCPSVPLESYSCLPSRSRPLLGSLPPGGTRTEPPKASPTLPARKGLV